VRRREQTPKRRARGVQDTEARRGGPSVPFHLVHLSMASRAGGCSIVHWSSGNGLFDI
jgi:hypothetical protein